jgi:cobalamin 5'-phosphate synthase/cobalamin synthase
MKIVDRLLLTASCVTAFPISARAHDTENLAGLSKYLPAVGLIIAGGLALIAWLCHLLDANHMVTGAVLTLGWLAMSGGIHLDGLMDTADGVLSHRSRERMLEIMQDSRVGNFGVMAGAAVLLIKFACLSAASLQATFMVALLVPAWARWTETLTIASFPYARVNGMGKVWRDTTRLPQDVILAAFIPTLATVAAALYGGWQTAIFLSVATVLSGYTAAYRIWRVLGGQTGDTYGAVVEISESGGLLLAAVLLPMFHSY